MKKYILFIFCVACIHSSLLAINENVYQSPFGANQVETPTIDYRNNSRTFNMESDYRTGTGFESNTWKSTSSFRNNQTLRTEGENGYMPFEKKSWESTSYFSHSELFNEKKDFTMADDNLTTGRQINENTVEGIRTKNSGTGVVEPISDSVILWIFGCFYALYIRRKKQ